ncbi:MAG: type II/IV secretion system protein [Sulfuritalea sp.]|nr:type II/IV secretion system protein [Sulfuritalea sp.]
MSVQPSAIADKLLPERLAQARAQARAAKRPLDAVLADATGLNPEDLLRELGRHYRFPTLRLEHGSAINPDFDTLGVSECRRRRMLIRRAPEGLQALFTDPLDEDLQLWADASFGPGLAWVLVLESELSAHLERLESEASALPNALSGSAEAGRGGRHGAAIEEISFARLDETSSPVVRLFNSTLYDALGLGASDIHLESGASGLIVKYRIDGVLGEVGRTEGIEFTEKVLSRIKVMAELDITERRIPQDGRFKVRIRERDVDFRVSIMPSVFGEDAVIRILDKENLSDQLSGLTLDHLGFDASTLAIIRRLAREPHGMLLVTGPTGSGKTTSLYAALSEINDGHDKIITIEDPVEYHLAGVLQIPVNERKGLTFARGLRSILRHDPDKIMVGEIRDAETAQIAVQAALTGHLVFSTVHANNVFDVLGRFEHMQVDPYSLVSALNGIVAQRLLRINCPHCSEEVAPVDQGLGTRRRGHGCALCRGTGYKGRRAIGECLLLDDQLREMIATRSPIRTIKEAARRRGTRLLRESAEELVRSGLTTLEEIDRVTFARAGQPAADANE